MNPSTDTSSVQSPLDKPLSELTEDDIAQLTREDCRRFLKQKGMRRPSWNKSQAIQQVISLKALLEDRPDSALRKSHNHPTLPPPPPPPPPPVTSPQQVSVPSMRVAEDPSPYRRKDPNPIPPPALFTCPPRAFPANEGAVVGKDHQLSPSPRGDPAQMTIFYGGKMNVYNDVPVEKARAIMQLASGPVAVGDLNDPPPEPVHARRAVHPRISIGPGPNGAFFASLPVGQPEWTSAREMEDATSRGSTAADCPTGRQASLQRYLEKRKDRYKGKRIIGSPSSMEMIFLSQKFRGQTPNEQSSQSNTSSPSQPRPPCTPTRCSSIENQAQKFRLSVDLNDDGGGN